MSEHVRAAHSRIRRHPRLPSDGVNARSNVDPALASPRSRLLSDLSELPEPCSTSKVFTLDEAELQIPGVRLFVRSEEQPYLRGAVNALECLIESHGLENLKSCGVVGQERSPHVEDMAIAASAYGIPVYVADLRRTDINNRHERRLSKVVLEVEQMHIDGQKAPVVANDVPVPFPLHHHAEVIHGQGTMALQLEREMVTAMTSFQQGAGGKTPKFDAVISDMGNGCMLSGICMAYSGENTQVFGAAPSSGFWEHAARLSMAETLGPEQSKSNYWNDVEIPIGDVPWSVFTSTRDLAGVFDVDDNALKAAAHKVFEHSGLHIRPDEAAPLAVVLYNQDFRSIIARRVQDGRVWTIGVLLQPRKSTLTGRVSMLGAEVSNFQPFE